MIPRIGEPKLKGQKYTLRPGVYAILPKAGKLLLTTQFGPETEVQLPGGGIDPGESSLQALHREVLEETGWRIARPRRIGAFRRFVYMPEYDLWAEKLCTIYVAHPVRKIAPIQEVEHIAHWATPEVALATLDNDGDWVLLHRYLSGL